MEELVRVLFIGDDWAEDHHDVELEDEGGRRLARARLPEGLHEGGRRLARARLPEGLEGITRLHALVAEHAPAAWAELPSEQVAGQVVVGIETDRGPWVTALRAVSAMWCMRSTRSRRHGTASGTPPRVRRAGPCSQSPMQPGHPRGVRTTGDHPALAGSIPGTAPSAVVLVFGDDDGLDIEEGPRVRV